jgi:hypothetical protein
LAQALATCRAASDGGGIFNAVSGTLTIDDSVVLTNVAPVGTDLSTSAPRPSTTAPLA